MNLISSRQSFDREDSDVGVAKLFTPDRAKFRIIDLINNNILRRNL